MLKADFHIHTKYSLDSETPVEDIVARCEKVGINCVAISDHGNIDGALEVRKIAPFKVIIAEEIMTTYGEIMGLFLQETIPSGSSVMDTIAKIREQNGLVLIPHPFDRFRPSALDTSVLKDIVAQGQVDVLEVFNSRDPLYRSSAKAKAFALKHGIPGSAGSDAHTASVIGNAYVEMPDFNGRDEFLEALAQGKIYGHRTTYFTHINSMFSKIKRKIR